MTNTELIAQLEKLQKEATPAPWVADGRAVLVSKVEGQTVDVATFGLTRFINTPEAAALNARQIAFRNADQELVQLLANNLPQILQALRVQEAAQHPLMPKAIAHDSLCEVILLPTDNVACDCGARIINAVLDNFHAALQSNQEGE